MVLLADQVVHFLEVNWMPEERSLEEMQIQAILPLLPRPKMLPMKAQLEWVILQVVGFQRWRRSLEIEQWHCLLQREATLERHYLRQPGAMEEHHCLRHSGAMVELQLGAQLETPLEVPLEVQVEVVKFVLTLWYSRPTSMRLND
jgi:hypothetical protein